MSRTRLILVCLACFAWQVVLIPSVLTADQGNANKPAHKKKPGPAGQARKPARPQDLNLLSMEVKALRVLRGLEANPAQLAEIARIAKNTAAKPGKREAAKAPGTYASALKELRDALIANDEEKIDSLKGKVDELQEKDAPDLDDDVEITDAAEIEAGRVLNLLSPQQVVAYADGLADDLPEPVRSIVDGLEDARELKGEEWRAARDELAERVSWLACGLGGEKTSKLEQQVISFLDKKHGEQGKPSGLEAEIRKLVGNPGPTVLLKNVLEHDLAELLSNPQLTRATKACLKGRKVEVAAANDEPAPAHREPPPAHRPAHREKKPADAPPAPHRPPGPRKAATADLDAVLKSPGDYEEQDLRLENVTITGTAAARAENLLWLEVRTPSGTRVPPVMRGQKLTFVVAKAQTPEEVAQMAGGGGVNATIECHIKVGNPGKHWNARVHRIEVKPKS